ncbi:hypothetical protein Tco_0089463 [Tanacetum coccineum]
MIRSNGVDICHPGLSNLTLENGPFFENVINMVAPQLKNLTVEYWQGLHLISAPELVSLRFKDYSYEPNKPDAHTIVDLLQQLHSVKYLTLNLEIFQEMRALKNAKSALNCMAELKANIETNIAHVDQVMAPMECHEPSMHEQDKMKINKSEMRDQINSCWKDLSAQIEHGKSKTSDLFQIVPALKNY